MPPPEQCGIIRMLTLQTLDAAFSVNWERTIRHRNPNNQVEYLTINIITIFYMALLDVDRKMPPG